MNPKKSPLPFTVKSPAFDEWDDRCRRGESVIIEGSRIDADVNSDRSKVSYELVACIGAGGKGRAYKALNRSEGSAVATVVLKFPTFDPSYYIEEPSAENAVRDIGGRLERTSDEAIGELQLTKERLKGCRFAAKTVQVFNHLYNFGYVKDNGAYIDDPISVRVGVQEFLDPNEYKSLEAAVGFKNTLENVSTREWKLSGSAWVWLAQQIAAALTDVHNRRVVHGDIWPPNVFINAEASMNFLGGPGPEDTNTAHVRFIDFGASWVQGQAGIEAGYGLRHSYAPPEAPSWMFTRNEEVDVYAYGVMLFWLAVGPYKGYYDDLIAYHKLHTMDAALQQISADIRRLRRDISGESNDLPRLEAGEESHLSSSEQVTRIAREARLLQQLAESAQPSVSEHLEHLASIQNRVALLESDAASIESYEKLLEGRLLKKLIEDEKRRELLNDQSSFADSAEGRAEDVLCELRRAGYWRVRANRLIESLFYDPAIPQAKDAADLRSLLRERLRESTQGKQLLLQLPWAVDVIARCVGEDPASRPRMIDVLKEIVDRRRGPQELGTFAELAERTFKQIDEKLSDDRGSMLEHLIRHRVENMGALFGEYRGVSFDGSLSHKLIDLVDSRDVIVDYLVILIDNLNHGDWIAATTTLNMWQGKALGHDGRYLTANLAALKRGVGVRRLFSVSLDEVGARWFEQLLGAVAHELGYSLEDFSRFLSYQGDLNMRRQSSYAEKVKRNTDLGKAKRDAFKHLSEAFREALRDQLDANIKPAFASGWTQDAPHIRLNYDQRVETRLRFARILNTYNLFIDLWRARYIGEGGPDGNVCYSDAGWHCSPDVLHDHASNPLIWSTAFPNSMTFPNADALPGLFLGMCLKSTLDKSIRFRNEHPRPVIRHSTASSQEWILYETESRFRTAEEYSTAPELRRIKVFRSAIESPPSVDRLGRAFADEAVNIGILVPELVRALKRMSHRKASLITISERQARIQT